MLCLGLWQSMSRECTLTGRRREGGGKEGSGAARLQIGRAIRLPPTKAWSKFIWIKLDRFRQIFSSFVFAWMIESSFTLFRRSTYFLANSSKGCPPKTHPLSLMPSFQVGFQVNILTSIKEISPECVTQHHRWEIWAWTRVRKTRDEHGLVCWLCSWGILHSVSELVATI